MWVFGLPDDFGRPTREQWAVLAVLAIGGFLLLKQYKVL
jgi:hypothetical protein